MPKWQDFLTDEERQRIDAIPAERKALTAEYKRIYDRCRKRMEPTVNGKTASKTASQTRRKAGGDV